MVSGGKVAIQTGGPRHGDLPFLDVRQIAVDLRVAVVIRGRHPEAIKLRQWLPALGIYVCIFTDA